MAIAPQYVNTVNEQTTFRAGNGLPAVNNNGVYITDQSTLDAVVAAANAAGVIINVSTSPPPTYIGLSQMLPGDYASTADFQAFEQEELLSRAISVRDYGAVDDGVAAGAGSTDNYTPFMQAIADCNRYGRALYIPKGKGYYDMLSQGIIHPRGIPVIGDGEGSRVRVPWQTNTYPQDVPWMMGTYLSGQAADTTTRRGAYQEPGYQFKPAVSGQNVVQLVNPTTDAPVLAAALAAAGAQLVTYVEGPLPGTVTSNLPCEVNSIVAVDTSGTGNVTLAYALTDDFTTGYGATSTPGWSNGNTPGVNYLRPLNTGTLGGPLGSTGPAPYIETHNLLQGVSFYSQAGPALSLATYDCVIRDVHTNGYNGIAGDPISRTLFDNVTMESWRSCYNTGYGSHDNVFVRPKARRIAAPTGMTNSYTFSQFFVQGLEGAKSHHLIHPEFEEYVPAGLGAANVQVALGNGSSVIGGKITCKKDSCPAVQINDRCRIIGTVIKAGNQDGLRIAGAGSEVDNVRIEECSGGGGAFRVTAGATGNRLRGCTAGKYGSRTSYDIIYDQGLETRVVDCDTYSTLSPLAITTTLANTGNATENVVIEQLAPQGQTGSTGTLYPSGAVGNIGSTGVLNPGQGWHFHAAGAKTGTAGIAKLRIAITSILTGNQNRVFIAELDIAAATTAPWWIEGTAVLTAAGINLRVLGYDGTAILNPALTRSAAAASSVTGIYISVQNGNTGDTMNIYEASIEPITPGALSAAGTRYV